VFHSLFSAFTKQKNEPTPLNTLNQRATSFFPRPTPRVEGTPEELQERLRNRYIDRLGERVRKLRRALAARHWAAIKLEARQIGASGNAYGCEEIAEIASRLDELIPEGEISRANLQLKDARLETEILIQKIDSFLNAPGE
jgi:hypothetical protein